MVYETTGKRNCRGCQLIHNDFVRFSTFFRRLFGWIFKLTLQRFLSNAIFAQHFLGSLRTLWRRWAYFGCDTRARRLQLYKKTHHLYTKSDHKDNRFEFSTQNNKRRVKCLQIVSCMCNSKRHCPTQPHVSYQLIGLVSGRFTILHRAKLFPSFPRC